MANIAKLSLSDENTRKVRKLLTRAKDGSFETCETHERRMRADSFEIMLIADSESGEVSAHATAHVTCGHSKKPCEDTRTVMLANAAGLNPEITKKLSLVSADDDENGASESKSA